MTPEDFGTFLRALRCFDAGTGVTPSYEQCCLDIFLDGDHGALLDFIGLEVYLAVFPWLQHLFKSAETAVTDETVGTDDTAKSASRLSRQPGTVLGLPAAEWPALRR